MKNKIIAVLLVISVIINLYFGITNLKNGAFSTE